MSSAWKASSVGAKTVNGPSDFKVSTRPALITAASKADKLSVAITRSTKSCGGASASSTA